MVEVEDEGGELSGRQAIVAKRLAICSECPRLIKRVQICKECGCFMPAKVWLLDSWCPLQKWGQEELTEED